MKHRGEGPVDFTRSIPPLPPLLGSGLGQALCEIGCSANLGLLLRNSYAAGTEADRQAGAQWLARRFEVVPTAEHVVVTNGTQNIVTLLLQSLVGPNNLLLSEALTYSALRPLADRVGVRIEGVAIDDDGVIPDAFDEACRQHRPKALYCNPTVQNPTATMMSRRRREEIAAIARRHGVAILEDDVLGNLHEDAPPPIAAFAPDITWYFMGLTKCLAHGLRIAYLLVPDLVSAEAVIGPVRKLSTWFPSPLSAAVANRWINDGTAGRITQAIKEEAEARQAIAARLLAGADYTTQPGALHLWLRLPTSWPRSDFVKKLCQAGVLVRPSDLFAVNDSPPPEAVRLSLSSPLNRDDVERGLSALADVLRVQSP